jgi:hypothetical protein
LSEWVAQAYLHAECPAGGDRNTERYGMRD